MKDHVKIFHEKNKEELEKIKKLIEDGYTGRKWKGGFYRMNKFDGKKIMKNNDIKKSLTIMSKYKNFLLLIINNKNISKENDIYTLRYYGIGAQIIKELKIKNMILVSRSKKRMIALDGYGIKIKKQEIIK